MLKLYMCEKFSEFLSSETTGTCLAGMTTVGMLFFCLHCYTIALLFLLFSHSLLTVYNVKREKPLWGQAAVSFLSSVLCLVALFC